MDRLIAIDPGKHLCAWAIFDGNQLEKCGMCSFQNFEKTAELMCLDYFRELVIEVPMIYSARNQKGNPNDLIDVAISGGLFAGVISNMAQIDTITRIHPSEWKGQRPKKVDNEHTLGLLYDTERQLVESCGVSKGKLHNVIDAVGIGLWRLDRR